MDAKQVAQNLVDLSGGCANISSVTHCSTRLRFIVRNKASVKTDGIKAIQGVLGVVFTTDELQIVLGKNVIPVYTEAVKIYEAAGGKAGGVVPDDDIPAEKPKLTGKARVADLGNRLIGFVSASVTPLIPGLVSGGMLKVFLLLATLVYPAFEGTSS